MVCLGFEPGAAGWWAQTDPLSHEGLQQLSYKKFYEISP